MAPKQYVFELTPYTRPRPRGRGLWVALLGAVPGAIIGVPLSPWIGLLALIPVLLSATAAVWLFACRSRTGLQVWNWEAIWDRWRYKPVFRYGGHVVDPGRSTMYRLVSLSVPVRQDPEDGRAGPGDEAPREPKDS